MNNNQTLAEAQAGLEAVENAIEVRSTLDTNIVIKNFGRLVVGCTEADSCK